MQMEHTNANGKSYTGPILRDLQLNASSYTFTHPAGVIFLTQFAQPTLTLLEKATFVDLQSKGLIQQGAKFAGHSLGEYGALGSMTCFMPIEKLISFTYYRGLTMSFSMKRDERGRTDYSMMAVNTSRVVKGQDVSSGAIRLHTQANTVDSASRIRRESAQTRRRGYRSA